MAGTERNKNDLLEPPWLSQQAMAQLFRGELSRSDTWRTRLDTTTNWALTTTAAVISFGFATPQSSHVTFLVGIWMVLSFLLIEARRYRYYDLWNRRVRLLEDGWWAPMLRREPVDPDAMRELAVEMSRPQIQLSLFSAISTRLNRAYGPILMVLMATWFVKVYSHPKPPKDFAEFLYRAHVAWLPGPVVMAFLVFLTIAATYLFISSFFIRAPMGELRTRPRGRRAALWESFYRPYAIHRRRTPAHRRPPSPRPSSSSEH
ncbi:DUF2270 domain-containing protein [Pyxidicoccus sp. MSG2]|uniref:DUF2270 domain-containing protein n=1 Tax=Pyxidicoccus sp. MSG2 TaxID=2996790 RepID=UPI00226EE34F|nr:DUF2270 domain-containing protein [Pyxidicoccus sp. MSG2]MCY1019974.1 DUF2270 domain-containing protein [Pyxidicoccus sp. MSG2]